MFIGMINKTVKKDAVGKVTKDATKNRMKLDKIKRTQEQLSEKLSEAAMFVDRSSAAQKQPEVTVASKQIQEVRVDTRERWSHPLCVNEAIIVVKLDTGASANLISERDYMSLSPRPKLRKACVRLTDYNNKEIASLGSCVLDCVGNSD